jgi:transcriptional regulator with XRE-family HTH domain
MMKDTFGKRLASLRKQKRWTQEEVAEKLKVSGQAVSKWENDASFPDLDMVVAIADLFQVSTDYLLGKVAAPVVSVSKQTTDLSKLVCKIKVLSSDGDNVNINLPVSLLLMAFDAGMMPKIEGRDVLKDIDMKKVIELVQKGVLGKIVDIHTADGDVVEIVVE